MRVAAIIPVAGLSSRMRDFKPLMALNGFAMVQLTVQAVIDGGASDVFVVTGREHDRVEAVLSEVVRDEVGHKDGVAVDSPSIFEATSPDPPTIHFVVNRDYTTTDMLHSVQRGIAALPTQEASADFDAVLIVPGDVPAFSPKTVAALIKQAAQSDAEVICPAHGQASGHPLLVKRKCFKPICSYDGEGGLRQALAPSLRECLDVDDEAILLDADTPEAFGRLEEYVLASKGVSDEIAAALFERFSTPKNVQAHCRAVAKLATRMASHLNKQGYGLDSKLCRSAALLHDLNRLQEHHAHVAAENLRALGYEAIAKIVQVHQDGIDLSEEMFSETNIVFLADKLVRETEIVTPKTRYAKALERFSASPEITKRITQDLELSEELLKNYTESTGDDLMTMLGTTLI